MSEINATSLLTQQRAGVAVLKQSFQQEVQAAALVDRTVQAVEDPNKASSGNGRLVDIVI